MASQKKRRALTLEVPVDHQAGQLKAELFEELLSRLAEKIFPGAKVSRNYILRRKNSSGIETPTSVDLLVEARPNTLLLSNKLKSVFSDGAKVFKKLDTKALKNIGEAIVWERDYGTGT